MNSAQWPFRVDCVTAASLTEWRIGDELEPRPAGDWQLVYLRSGIVEESCDDRRVTLRPGHLLFHQPEEVHAMRAVGEVPPEVFRVEFRCEGSGMDIFRGRQLLTNAAERSCLRLMVDAAHEVFAPPAEPGEDPQLRAEPPYAAQELLTLYLAQLLCLTGRRLRRTRRPGPRARAEQNQAALVEGVRLYFAEHIDEPLTLEEVCRDNGCTRAALQQAFRARTHMGPMEAFSRMKAEQAGVLLAQGYGSGEVARMLGYSSQAWFSRRFTALTGQTPGQYRRAPRPLHLCEW